MAKCKRTDCDNEATTITDSCDKCFDKVVDELAAIREHRERLRTFRVTETTVREGTIEAESMKEAHGFYGSGWVDWEEDQDGTDVSIRPE